MLITATEHLLQCKVRKGDDIRQEDHLIYSGGPLIMSSAGTRPLWAASTFINLDRRAFAASSVGRCAAAEIRYRPVRFVGFTGSILWWATAKELLKRVLCEESHISRSHSKWDPPAIISCSECSFISISGLDLMFHRKEEWFIVKYLQPILLCLSKSYLWMTKQESVALTLH